MRIGFIGRALKGYPEEKREHRHRLGTVQPQWGADSAAIIGWRHTAVLGWVQGSYHSMRTM